MHDLKSEIRTALAGTSSKSPMDTSALAKQIHRRRTYVETALMEMYQACEVYCCKVIKGGNSEIVLWWISGVIEYEGFYGKKNEANTPKPVAKKVVRRTSDLTENVLAVITAQPGMTAPEIIQTLLLSCRDKQRQTQKIYNSITSLISCSRVRKEGERRHGRFFPGVTE